jgi:ribokinase
MKTNTKTIVLVGVLAALSYVLMIFPKIPGIIPAFPWLDIDFSDVPALLAAVAVSPIAGVLVVLNPAPARKLPKELYSLVDWITPNETEAELLTGVKVVDAASAAKAASILKKRGVGHVVITLGKMGAYCGDCGKIYPVRKVKTVDCVAAGDTFNGAFTVALVEGKSCKEAIRFAQEASTIAVTRPGAQSSIPFRNEIDL